MNDVTLEVRHKGRLIYQNTGEGLVSAGARDRADAFNAIIAALGAVTGYGTPVDPVPEPRKRPQLRLVS